MFSSSCLFIQSYFYLYLFFRFLHHPELERERFFFLFILSLLIIFSFLDSQLVLWMDKKVRSKKVPITENEAPFPEVLNQVFSDIVLFLTFPWLTKYCLSFFFSHHHFYLLPCCYFLSPQFFPLICSRYSFLYLFSPPLNPFQFEKKTTGMKEKPLSTLLFMDSISEKKENQFAPFFSSSLALL